MIIPQELLNHWKANYEHGDYTRIAKHGVERGIKVSAEMIKKSFQRGSATNEVKNLINDYFEQKKKFHKNLISRLQHA